MGNFSDISFQSYTALPTVSLCICHTVLHLRILHELALLSEPGCNANIRTYRTYLPH